MLRNAALTEALLCGWAWLRLLGSLGLHGALALLGPTVIAGRGRDGRDDAERGDILTAAGSPVAAPCCFPARRRGRRLHLLLLLLLLVYCWYLRGTVVPCCCLVWRGCWSLLLLLLLAWCC